MDVEEDRRRAEVFDALSHPTRILILKALNEGPLGFADLKKKTGIESSGNLQHHLSKLNELVRNDQYGKYTLSDQGRDALHSVETVEQTVDSDLRQSNRTRNWKNHTTKKPVVITLAILLVVSSVVALFEYGQIGTPKHNQRAKRRSANCRLS